jgi:hypothetical protein
MVMDNLLVNDSRQLSDSDRKELWRIVVPDSDLVPMIWGTDSDRKGMVRGRSDSDEASRSRTASDIRVMRSDREAENDSPWEALDSDSLGAVVTQNLDNDNRARRPPLTDSDRLAMGQVRLDSDRTPQWQGASDKELAVSLKGPDSASQQS